MVAAWFSGMLLPAGTPATNVVNLATALHRDALALELTRTPGWTSRTYAAITRWPTNMNLWAAWEKIYCGEEKNLSPGASSPGVAALSLHGAEPAGLGTAHTSQAARTFYDQHRAALDEGAELLWPEVENLYTLMCQRRRMAVRRLTARNKTSPRPRTRSNGRARTLTTRGSTSGRLSSWCASSRSIRRRP